MRVRLIAVGVLAALAAATGALAQDDRWCSGISDSAETSELKVARVVGKDRRVHFVSNPGDTGKTQDCPDLSAECRRRGFVVPGDRVETVRGPLACVSYVNARAAESGGWLPLAALELSGQPAEAKLGGPALQDWAGSWKRAEASIQIRVAGAMLEADGTATYGAASPERVARGAINTGEFSGKVRPRGALAAFGEGYTGDKEPDSKSGECQVRARLFAPYLVVDDNRNCGGMNVSFSGVYVRVGK